MKPKVYLAGSFPLRQHLRRIRTELEAMGYTVTSRWLDVDERPVMGNTKTWTEYAHKWGVRDYEDVLTADIVVIDLTIPSTSGGTHVELGLALGRGKKVLFIGERKTVFHYLD